MPFGLNSRFSRTGAAMSADLFFGVAGRSMDERTINSMRENPAFSARQQVNTFSA
jgi:hypothetical protein